MQIVLLNTKTFKVISTGSIEQFQDFVASEYQEAFDDLEKPSTSELINFFNKTKKMEFKPIEAILIDGFEEN